MSRESLYEAVGGADALLKLAHAWHRRCLDDPIANHPFSHPGIHPQHTERLAAYLGEALRAPGSDGNAELSRAPRIRLLISSPATSPTSTARTCTPQHQDQNAGTSTSGVVK